MGLNLYEFLKAHNYQGFDTDLLRKWAIQILKALRFLAKRKVIHCDLKPENILLDNGSEENIKVIDLGSSCFEHQKSKKRNFSTNFILFFSSSLVSLF